MYVERDVPSAPPSIYFSEPAHLVSAPERADDAALQAAQAGGRTVTSTKTYSFGRPPCWRIRKEPRLGSSKARQIPSRWHHRRDRRSAHQLLHVPSPADAGGQRGSLSCPPV